MAAPHVSGLVALLMQQGMTKPAAIEAAIKRYATDRGATGRDDDYGYGIVNARETLRGMGLTAMVRRRVPAPRVSTVALPLLARGHAGCRRAGAPGRDAHDPDRGGRSSHRRLRDGRPAVAAPPSAASTPSSAPRPASTSAAAARSRSGAGRCAGLFVEVDVSRFEETGERVFVFNGEVFPLGIPLTDHADAGRGLGGLSVVRARRAATAPRRGRLVPYAYFGGGGVGSIGYPRRTTTTRSPTASRAYHVIGGADVPGVEGPAGRRGGALSLGPGRPRRGRRVRSLQRVGSWRHDVPRPHRRRLLGRRAAPGSGGRHRVHAPRHDHRPGIPAGRVATYGDVAVLAGRPAPPAPSATSCGAATTRPCPATG